MFLLFTLNINNLQAAILAPTDTLAGDTLYLTLKQSEARFTEKNLMLLAARFQVDAATALVKQARLYNNPFVTAEGNFYNGQKNKYVDIGKTGEKIFTIDQLIQTAGKRNKNIQIASENAKLSENYFLDLLRTLKFDLVTSFYSVHYLQKSISMYEEQIRVLQNTVNQFEVQYKKGNIPLKEVVRLKAFVFQLINEKNEMIIQRTDRQNILQTYLQTKQHVVPQVEEKDLKVYDLEQLNQKNLVELALSNRPDLQAEAIQLKIAHLNTALQKAKSVPDIHVGGLYDQAGSYIPKYTGISLGMDIPVWNRNQGNIKATEYLTEAQKRIYDNKINQINNEIISSLYKIKSIDELYDHLDLTFTNEFELLNQGVIENFRKRNLSLIEFIDLFETYMNSIKEMNRLNINRINAYEELSFLVGIELYR
jgi:cobalt-zinc-cadmium efflux system outer membrane protein